MYYNFTINAAFLFKDYFYYACFVSFVTIFIILYSSVFCKVFCISF